MHSADGVVALNEQFREFVSAVIKEGAGKPSGHEHFVKTVLLDERERKEDGDGDEQRGG